MIVGRPRETSCLHCEAPAERKGKCIDHWREYEKNQKRKAKNLPYTPLPVLPREYAGRTPAPRPQEPMVPMEPVSVTMVNGVRITKCLPNLDAEFVERGLGRIAALRRAEREWRG